MGTSASLCVHTGFFSTKKSNKSSPGGSNLRHPVASHTACMELFTIHMQPERCDFKSKMCPLHLEKLRPKAYSVGLSTEEPVSL